MPVNSFAWIEPSKLHSGHYSNTVSYYRKICKQVPVSNKYKLWWDFCFRGMFCAGLKESGQREITVQQVDYKAMECVVRFFYTSQITVCFLEKPFPFSFTKLN